MGSSGSYYFEFNFLGIVKNINNIKNTIYLNFDYKNIFKRHYNESLVKKICNLILFYVNYYLCISIILSKYY